MKFEAKYVRCIWEGDLPSTFIGAVADSGDKLKEYVETNVSVTVSKHSTQAYPFTAKDSCWHLAYYDPNYACKIAYDKGKEIQVWSDEADEWLNDATPDWTQKKYRIKPEITRMTNRQLAEWLARGNGQVSYNGSYVSCGCNYITEADDKEIAESYRIRRWGSGIWIEPTEDVYKEDCK